MHNVDLESFMERLFEVGCVKFGEFMLSSGLKTPVYFDLRILVSFPDLLKQAGRLLKQYLHEHELEYDLICGVPYGAFALATSLSMQNDKPMVYKRKEAKDYGCKKMVEGIFKPGDKCLLIEDVVVYGTSIIETAQCLRDYELNVVHSIALLDREQGGPANMNDHGIKFHSLIKATDLLQFLYKKGKISKEIKLETIEFLRKHSYQASLHSNIVV